MNKIAQTGTSIIAFTFFALSLATGTTAQSKSFAYRTSSAQTYSSSLGITCVPAYVLLNKVAHQGIFVVSAPTTELGKKMNLTPGMVLLTVDNYSMISATAADSWISHRSKRGPISFTVAVDNNGQAQVHAGSVQADSATAVATASANSSSNSTLNSHGSRSAVSAAVVSGSIAVVTITLLNKSRVAGGLAPLEKDATLSQFAQSYAEYLANNASKYDVKDNSNNPHRDLNGRNQIERAQQAGITNWLNETIGRNVGGPNMGGVPMGGVNILHNQMMASPGHRSAIMDAEAHSVGVGSATIGDRFFLVEEFGR
jgi:uncharacterized protein YkwD